VSCPGDSVAARPERGRAEPRRVPATTPGPVVRRLRTHAPGLNEGLYASPRKHSHSTRKIIINWVLGLVLFPLDSDSFKKICLTESSLSVLIRACALGAGDRLQPSVCVEVYLTGLSNQRSCLGARRSTCVVRGENLVVCFLHRGALGNAGASSGESRAV